MQVGQEGVREGVGPGTPRISKGKLEGSNILRWPWRAERLKPCEWCVYVCDGYVRVTANLLWEACVATEFRLGLQEATCETHMWECSKP